MPQIILIGGVTGTLKSTTAVTLAADLGYLAVGTDELREVMRLYDDDVFLKGTSHDRWQVWGDYSPEQAWEGYRRQAARLLPAVEAVTERSVSRGAGIVVEGVHLLPSLYAGLGDLLHVLLLEREEAALQENLRQKHRSRPAVAASWTGERVRQLLDLQQRLVAEAGGAGAVTLETASARRNAAAIVRLLGGQNDSTQS